MSRNLPLPFLAVPPAEYQQSYFSALVQSITTYMRNERNPGEGRHTTLVLTALPSSDQGLEVGGLFEHGGFVKITKANTPHVGSLLATGSVGSVTVSTP